MNQEAKSSRIGFTLASTLGVLGFVLSLISLGWQVHVHEESLTDKALVRFSISFLNNDKEILSVTKTAKHQSNVDLDPSSINKNELSAEVVNIGERPLYVKQVRLIVPCPETGNSDSITLQPAKDSPPGGALQPGAATIYKAGPWNLFEHPLTTVDPPERFCVAVESNKGIVTQTGEISYVTFSISEQLKSTLMRPKTGTPVRDPLGLYGPENKDLSDCLNKVNPGDPAGLRGESQAQAEARKACIEKYSH